MEMLFPRFLENMQELHLFVPRLRGLVENKQTFYLSGPETIKDVENDLHDPYVDSTPFVFSWKTAFYANADSWKQHACGTLVWKRSLVTVFLRSGSCQSGEVQS